MIDLGQMPARMRKPVRQFAVVGEQEQAFGKIVEPPHGVEALAAPGFGHKVEHGLAPLGVACGGHHLHGLVEHEPAGLRALLPQHDRAAVQAYRIPGHDAHAGIVRNLPVHTDSPGKNIFIGLTARAYAGIRQRLVQSYSFSHVSPGAFPASPT